MNTDLSNCFSDFPHLKAAYSGNLKEIQKITLERINETDKRGLTPLMLAILTGNEICSKFLIENGADVNLQTSVPLSSTDGQERDRVKSIFYDKNVTELELIIPFDKQITALHLAATLGQDAIVLLLCQQKAKVNARSAGGVSALMYAALFGHQKCVETLLQFKSKLDFSIKTQSVYGWFDAGMTALHAAAQSGNCELIKILLAHNMNVKDNTKADCSLLFFAARSYSFETVKLLLDAGASTQIDNPNYYNDPMTECILRSDVKSAALIIQNLKELDGIGALENGRKVFLWQPPIRMAIRYQEKEIIKLLLNAGASKPEYKNIDDALFWGDVSEVSALLKAGKKPREVGFSGFSHLYEAVNNGYAELIVLLLENGYGKTISEQEINSRDKLTPLHLATIVVKSSSHPLEKVLYSKQSYEIAEILLENGANPNALDFFERTPLQISINNGNKEMIDLLLKYGANNDLLKSDKFLVN